MASSLTPPQRSERSRERVQVVDDALSARTCVRGGEQTGLVGPKAGERAPAQLITRAACARVCICVRIKGQ